MPFGGIKLSGGLLKTVKVVWSFRRERRLSALANWSRIFDFLQFCNTAILQLIWEVMVSV